MPLPTSLPWLESVDAKLSRAREHLSTLSSEVDEFLKSVKRNLVLKTNAEETEAWMVYWVDDPYPPMRLSAIIGDCAFNMRSALDNVVCGLVRTKDPSNDCSGLQFPISRDFETYRKLRSRCLRGVPEDAKKLIDGVQPHNRPSGSIELDPLYMLSTLNNRDKHRALNLTTGFTRNTRFAIHANDGSIHFVKLAAPLYTTGPETIPLQINPKTIQPSARVEAAGTGVLAFRDEGPWGERAVADVLTTCLTYIETRVIEPLKPFFKQR